MALQNIWWFDQIKRTKMICFFFGKCLIYKVQYSWDLIQFTTLSANKKARRARRARNHHFLAPGRVGRTGWRLWLVCRELGGRPSDDCTRPHWRCRSWGGTGGLGCRCRGGPIHQAALNSQLKELIIG